MEKNLEKKSRSLFGIVFGVVIAVIVAAIIVSVIFVPKKNAAVAAGQPASTEYWGKSKMEPCGEVILKEEPKRIACFTHNQHDILETFGWGDRVVATGWPQSFYYAFMKQLPNFNWEIKKENKDLKFFLFQTYAFDKELFYLLDPDIIHLDPYRLNSYKGWTMDDIDEIKTRVAPFFDNAATALGDDAISRSWGKMSGQFLYTFDEYTRAYYKLYNQVEKGEKLLAFIHDLEARIQEKIKDVPKPTIALLRWTTRGTTHVGINTGMQHLQYRVLGARDAFRGQENKILPKEKEEHQLVGHIDLEGLFEVDPDVIIMPYVLYAHENPNHIIQPSWDQLMTLKTDPLGKKLNAVKNNRIYPGGTLFQGPIHYPFQLEMTAKQLYPQIFGEFKIDHNYSKDEQLFDRSELAKLINE